MARQNTSWQKIHGRKPGIKPDVIIMAVLAIILIILGLAGIGPKITIHQDQAMPAPEINIEDIFSGVMNLISK